MVAHDLRRAKLGAYSVSGAQLIVNARHDIKAHVYALVPPMEQFLRPEAVSGILHAIVLADKPKADHPKRPPDLSRPTKRNAPLPLPDTVPAKQPARRIAGFNKGDTSIHSTGNPLKLRGIVTWLIRILAPGKMVSQRAIHQTGATWFIVK